MTRGHDDGLDMDRVTQRRTSAALTGVQKPPGAASSVFDVARPPPKKRLTAPEFDPLAIEIKTGVPLPATKTGAAAIQGARYQALLDRMKPGDCVELPSKLARGIQAWAKGKSGVKLSLRKISDELVGVWRVHKAKG